MIYVKVKVIRPKMNPPFLTAGLEMELLASGVNLLLPGESQKEQERILLIWVDLEKMRNIRL